MKLYIGWRIFLIIIYSVKKYNKIQNILAITNDKLGATKYSFLRFHFNQIKVNFSLFCKTTITFDVHFKSIFGKY